MQQDLFALKLREKDMDETVQLSVDMEQGIETTGYVTTPVPTVAVLTAKRADIAAKKLEMAAAASALSALSQEVRLARARRAKRAA
jgi:hypothetical protein